MTNSIIKATYNPSLDKFASIPMFEKEYEEAVAFLRDMPLPFEMDSISPSQRVTILLNEVEIINEQIANYNVVNRAKIDHFLLRKKQIVKDLEQIMATSFKISFLQNAA